MSTSILNYTSIASGIVCGTAVGYTSTNGDPTASVLIASGCGVARAVSTLLFQRSVIEKIIADHNAQVETGDTQANISSVLYKASWGFSIGLAIGTGASTTTILSGLFNGFIVHTAGFLTEVLPIAALTKPTQINIDPDGRGTLI